MHSKAVIALLTAAYLPSVNAAFGVSPRPACVRRGGTALNLEDNVAEMIDKEMHRLQHLNEYGAEWHKKNRAMIEPTLPTEMDVADDPYEVINRVVPVRDRRLADRDPQSYCADRCVGSGYCEVYEDLFDMTPSEVLAFCSECVLSEEEEPCGIPDKMYATIELEEGEVEELRGEMGSLKP
eukprot:CAMPEP_0113590900 /NCGR_PEP_ID=MMETSP0015_2-20120614/36945_1 /TAXON_ID=2838 /ORGANISM="Odontella" /LENGTH=180 /DNA_ID=CAMNT_0000497171 /DNA_START=121 /DNA_END=663 /DNA_ORIENTATION=+ /assembly_acc=CAM_ASM_000160